MALNIARLKAAIKAAMYVERLEEEDSELSADRFAEAIAAAVIYEITQAKITYTSGLTAPNGAVTGTFTNTIS